MTRRTVTTPTLEVAYEESGPPDGPPVVLLHGFPYDVGGFEVVPGAGHDLPQERPQPVVDAIRTLLG